MDYLAFFQLDDDPFRLTPDPQYFFPSQEHNEILNSLNYAIEQKEGFSLVVGQPGTGKTTILRILIDHWKDKAEIALVMTPRLSPEEFLQAILEDLNIKLGKKSKNEMLKTFRDVLIKHSATGKRIIIIVDEAQNVPDDTIEELRLLSNLETEKEKLLQIILMGQPELKKKLEAAHLRQLDQRITIRAILRPLTRSETSDYINFRLIKAGKGTIVFEDKARKKIYSMSKGIPRLINLVASRALMAAFVSGSAVVSADHVKFAVEHLAGEGRSFWERYLPWFRYGAIGLALFILAVIGFYKFSGTTTAKMPAAPAAAGTQVQNVETKGAAEPATSASSTTAPSVQSQKPAAKNSPKAAFRPTGKKPETQKAVKVMPPETELPQPASSKKYVTVAAPSANMRGAPDIGSEKVAWVAKGATYPVLESRQDTTGRTWYRVQHPSGKECWISKRVVTEKNR